MAPEALTPLALSVLALLHERDMHPYEMHQTMVTRHFDARVKLKAGSLYHTVERLQRLDLVEALETHREGKRPERTVYGVTAAGREAFATKVREMLARVPREYPEYPVALSFAHALPLVAVTGHLRRRCVQLESEIAAADVVIARLSENGPGVRYWVDLKYARAQRRAELDWTTELVADLEAGRIAWDGPDHAPDDRPGDPAGPPQHEESPR